MKPRRSSLTWVDFLVIAVSVLTFAAIVSSAAGNGRHAAAGPSMAKVWPRA